MSEQNAKVAGLVFKDIVKHQGPNDDVAVFKLRMIPYHEGEENRAQDEVRATFNKSSTANLMTRKIAEQKLKVFEGDPRHAKTVEEIRRGLTVLDNREALEKNATGAHLSASSQARLQQKIGMG